MCSFFFFSSRRRHTRYIGDWSSDVCSSDLENSSYLRDRSELFSSVLIRVEVVRAVRLQRKDVSAVDRFLGDMNLLELTADILSVAASLASATVRSLDAIHLASALSLVDRISSLVTYD